MTQVVVAAGANASLTRGIYPPVDIGALAKAVVGASGLVHFVDPEAVPNSTINGTPVTAFDDRASGRPWRASIPLAPIVATEAGVANSRTLFDVQSATECDLTAIDATATPSFTFINLWRPMGHSIDGSVRAYLCRSTEAGTPRLGLSSVVSGTPALVFGDETLLWGVSAPISGHLSLAVPAVVAVTLDQATKNASIFINDGVTPVASAVVPSVASYPKAQWTLFGAKINSNSSLSRHGRAAIWNRALASGANSELASIIAQFKTYYGVS